MMLTVHFLLNAAFYLLAKIEEALDKPIYKLTHHIVSGHTLKHLCAAIVPVFLTLMLAKRTVATERYKIFVLHRSLVLYFVTPEFDGHLASSIKCHSMETNVFGIEVTFGWL